MRDIIGTMKRKRKIPESRTIDLPHRDYQPSKVEKEEEVDMPGASLKKVRSAFMRPFIVHRKNSKD